MALPQTYKALQIGDNADLSIKEFSIPTPSTNQVLVKVAFAPINPTDFNKLAGFYGNVSDDPATRAIGSEGSGIVVAVGDNLKVPHKVGDRVHILSEAWNQYVLAPSESFSPVLQDDLSLEEAASHWINPATVYYMGVIAERGGHKAAIHNAGASALGRMLIRYFKHKGIKLINIVRRDEYIEELKKEGADYVLNSQAPDFEARFKEIVEKENATLAFDALGGDFTPLIIRNLPADSTCHVYGMLAGPVIGKINRVDLTRGKKLTVLFLPNYMQERIEKNDFQEFQKEVHSHLTGLFRTNVHKVFPLEDFKEALAYYHKNSSKGKILFKPN